MAAAGNNLSYVLGAPGTGWREIDLRNAIIDQDPRFTPFFEMTGTATATGIKHEWQARGLRARAVNTFAEGGDFTYSDVVAPTRYSNTAQIIEDGVEVSASSQAERHYGVKNLMRDQIALNLTEHRGDTEYSLLHGVETTANTASNRQMDGLMASLTTGATAMAGATLTETFYVGMMEDIYTRGGKPDTVLAGTKQQNIINNFDSFGATRYMDVRIRDVVNSVLTYHSSYGAVMNFISLDLSNASTTGQLAMFEKSMFKKAYLRTTKAIPVAKTMDGDRMAIVTECTLEYANEEAGGVMTQLASP